MLELPYNAIRIIAMDCHQLEKYSEYLCSRTEGLNLFEALKVGLESQLTKLQVDLAFFSNLGKITLVHCFE